MADYGDPEARAEAANYRARQRRLAEAEWLKGFIKDVSNGLHDPSTDPDVIRLKGIVELLGGTP